jgi:hypothetical protein
MFFGSASEFFPAYVRKHPATYDRACGRSVKPAGALKRLAEENPSTNTIEELRLGSKIDIAQSAPSSAMLQQDGVAA